MTRRVSLEPVSPASARCQTINALVHALALTGPRDSAQQIADTAIRELARGLDTELAKLLTLDATGQFLVVAAEFGWNPSIIDIGHIPATPTSQAGYALTVNGPIFFEDIARTKRFSDAALLLRYGVVSSLVMALRHQQHVLGVLSVHTRTRRWFTADEMDLVEQVGRALAEALVRARHGPLGPSPPSRDAPNA